MKTTNAITKFGAGAVAAAALMFGATGIAGAQDAEPVEPDTTEDTTDAGEQDRRSGRRGFKRALYLDVLDLTREEVAEQLNDGATLADIAGDQVDEVVDALVDAIEERLDAAVESERLTQEQADERRDGLEVRTTERLQNAPDRDGEGRRGHRGPGRGQNAQETNLVDS